MSVPGVMNRFEILELSLVDKPAQEGARITIAKAATRSTVASNAGPKPDQFPVVTPIEVGPDGAGANDSERKPVNRHPPHGYHKPRRTAGDVTGINGEQNIDEDEDDDEESATDAAIKAMIAKGAAIRKANGEREAYDATPIPETIDWEATKAANLDAIAKAARERHRVDPSRTYEQHYAAAVMTPEGQSAARWGR